MPVDQQKDKGAPQNGQVEENFSTESIEVDASNANVRAMLRIVLRDGMVVERELSNGETKIGKGPANDIIPLTRQFQLRTR